MQKALCEASNVSITYLDLSRIEQPRWILRPLDEQCIVELMRSIRHAGLLQPIVVRMRHGAHEIVFGSHRLEACRRLGMKQVPVIIRNMSEEEAFLARVSENLIRNSYVDPIVESRGYRMLVSKGWTIDAIGRKVGKSDSYICERLRLADRLSLGLQKRLSSRELSPSHAEIIARIEGPIRQEEVAEWVRKRRLSVRSLELLMANAPPPARVEVKQIQGECYVRIPKDFLDVMDISPNQTVVMYARGNKLILDNMESRQGGSCKSRVNPNYGGLIQQQRIS